MDWGFPQNVSTFGERIDATYGAIFYVTALAFLIVQGALIYFIIRYRHKEGRRARPIHGNAKLEVVWTVVPFVGVMFLALYSLDAWLDIKRTERIPANALTLGVHASQFEWNITYPGADGTLGTPDDFVRRNQLHFPVGRPVRVNLTAEEVIHAFFLPNFRVKQDAVPGMEIPVWFEATDTGSFQLGCAELCGLGHYRMRGSVTVHSAEDFETWQGSQGAVAANTLPAPTTATAR